MSHFLNFMKTLSLFRIFEFSNDYFNLLKNLIPPTSGIQNAEITNMIDQRQLCIQSFCLTGYDYSDFDWWKWNDLLEGDTEYTSEFKPALTSTETGFYFCNLDWNVYVLPFCTRLIFRIFFFTVTIFSCDTLARSKWPILLNMAGVIWNWSIMVGHFALTSAIWGLFIWDRNYFRIF